MIFTYNFARFGKWCAMFFSFLRDDFSQNLLLLKYKCVTLHTDYI